MKAETTTPHRESEIKVTRALVPGRDTAWQLEIESACVVYWYVCENVHYFVCEGAQTLGSQSA